MLQGMLNFSVPRAWGATEQSQHVAFFRLWEAGDIWKPGRVVALNGRNEDISCTFYLKEQKHTSILKRREEMYPDFCLAWPVVALVTDTDEDLVSNFHWEGFRSGGRTQKIVHIPHILEEPKQSLSSCQF